MDCFVATLLAMTTNHGKKPAVMSNGGLFWARNRGRRLFWTRYLPGLLDKRCAL